MAISSNSQKKRKPTILSMKRFWIALAIPGAIWWVSPSGKELRMLDDFFWLWFVPSTLILGSCMNKFFHKRSMVSTIDNFNENKDGIYYHNYQPPGKFSFGYHQTSMQLDATQRLITLKAGKAEKTYSFDDIKSWNYYISTNGEVSGMGIIGTLMVGGMNQRARDASLARSGFFIKMRDIEFPEWQIMFYPKKGWFHRMEGIKNTEHQLQQWMEVFSQVVNQNRE